MAHEVKSHLPGTFYRRPSPDEPPFKEVGDSVAEGDVIGIVEVMKSFHHVKATAAGKVSAFKVKNEEIVSAGQTLMEIEE
ncbi:MAG: acetyl-CoA carboxylase [Hyphomicrobiales bacterium]|nr:acetyl-CoA carboxylase [Hyphomicrobiales bacterium]